MSMSRGASVAIIGGSGLYSMEGMSDVDFVNVDTPFGKPSDSIVLGSLEGVRVAFLPRHGRGHRFNPSHIPARANIYALKMLGVERIISVSAVGSLREQFAPLDLVVPDQLIDRTRLRDSTFFDEDVVVHVALAEPFCAHASQVIYDTARQLDITAHSGGTMVVMEGGFFHQGGIFHVPVLGRRHYRDDCPTGSQAGPGGGNVLRHHGLDHRLRLLA